MEISSFDRNKLVHNLGQLRELLVYLGRLTNEVNNFVAADGSVLRDSTAVRALAARRKRRNRSSVISIDVQSKVASALRTRHKQPWCVGFRARGRPRGIGVRPCALGIVKLAGKKLADRGEAVFQFW